jgi:hypothetical protein
LYGIEEECVYKILQVRENYPKGKFTVTGGAVPQLFTSCATKDQLLNYILTGSTSNVPKRPQSDEEEDTPMLVEQEITPPIEKKAHFFCTNKKVNNFLL